MKILTIVGARPQIIKSAAITRAINKLYSNVIQEVVLHTGQHYDPNMSEVFFDQLDLPHPGYNLHVGSGLHGEQTGKMLAGIETVILKENPDYVLVYGDTNSTLAGALAAAKLGVKLVHVEAGLRSFNRSMPEEINRVVADHCADMLFTPTPTGLKNLQNEGLGQRQCIHCGDVMYDNALYYGKMDTEDSAPMGLKSGGYVLATIHRNTNTDDPQRLTDLFKALIHIASNGHFPVVLPLHPRTAKCMAEKLDGDFRDEIMENDNLHLIAPAGYIEMLSLEKHARLVITDSGGVQKEAYFFKKPCLVLRQETEWVEIVEAGAARLVDSNFWEIARAYNDMLALADSGSIEFPPIFGNGKAAETILELMMSRSARE